MKNSKDRIFGAIPTQLVQQAIRDTGLDIVEEKDHAKGWSMLSDGTLIIVYSDQVYVQKQGEHAKALMATISKRYARYKQSKTSRHVKAQQLSEARQAQLTIFATGPLMLTAERVKQMCEGGGARVRTVNLDSALQDGAAVPRKNLEGLCLFLLPDLAAGTVSMSVRDELLLQLSRGRGYDTSWDDVACVYTEDALEGGPRTPWRRIKATKQGDDLKLSTPALGKFLAQNGFNTECLFDALARELEEATHAA